MRKTRRNRRVKKHSRKMRGGRSPLDALKGLFGRSTKRLKNGSRSK